MFRLYKLLPGFYHLEDEALGFPLQKFLEPLQAKLDESYEDERTLREIQDPHRTPAGWLQYIAESLAWEFITDAEASRRNEAVEIVNFYDLKGTPYALRLLGNWIFGRWFRGILEFFAGGPGSISRLRRPWALADDKLKFLLSGQGEFAVPEWEAEQRERRGRAYDFLPEKPLWHYFLHVRVPPETYVPGEVRRAVERFLRQYERFHPAGRFCYLWIEAPSDEQGLHGTRIIDELIGGLYLDTAWELDDPDKTLDMATDPVHPSVSWAFPLDLYTLDDDARILDGDWVLDGGELSAHALLELR